MKVQPGLLPDSITVLGQIYRVINQQLPEDEMGKVCLDNYVVVIDYAKHPTAKALRHTLFHELIHATLHRIGVQSTDLTEQLEEVICECVATVLVENKI